LKREAKVVWIKEMRAINVLIFMHLQKFFAKLKVVFRKYKPKKIEGKIKGALKTNLKSRELSQYQ
jgi:hypothetical protein